MIQWTRAISLIELLICLAITSCILLLSLPLQRVIYERYQLHNKVKELTAITHFAKTQALIRQQSLTLEPLGSWSAGLILKHHDDVIHVWQWPNNSVVIKWKGFVSQHKLTFAHLLRHSASSGHFELSTSNFRQSITLNRVGRVYEKKITSVVL